MEYLNLLAVVSGLILYVLIIAACLCYIQQQSHRASYSK